MIVKCPKCGTVIPKDKEDDSFARNEAYIEHRKDFLIIQTNLKKMKVPDEEEKQQNILKV